MPAGLLPVPADEPVADGLCPDIRTDDPYLSIDEVYAASLTGFLDYLQVMVLPQKKMLLTADIPVHRSFPQLCPGIGEKTIDTGNPLLQGLVDGSPAHAPGGDYPQATIFIQFKVDPAGNGGPVVNLVFDELTVVLKGFDLLLLQIRFIHGCVLFRFFAGQLFYLQFPIRHRGIDLQAENPALIEKPYAATLVLCFQYITGMLAGPGVNQRHFQPQHLRIFSVHPPIQQPGSLHFEFDGLSAAAAGEPFHQFFALCGSGGSDKSRDDEKTE